MISPKQLAANRRNARSSRGPKTTSGKARSARNARRHGLAVPLLSDPVRAAEVEALTARIAGEDATPQIVRLARRIAEAQVDLNRVRMARRSLMEPGFSYSIYSPQRIKVRPRDRKLMEVLQGRPSAEKIALVLSDIDEQLQRLDRYERRALSRLKSAARAYLKINRYTNVPKQA